MNLKSFAAVVSLCLPLYSYAGVVYEWTGTNDQTPWDITLSMEFDNRTVKNGNFSINIGDENELVVPKRGLLSLSYTFPGMSQEMIYTSKDGQGFTFGRGYLRIDVQFDSAGYLTGSIYANDSNSHIDLASIGRTFTVLDANSDEGMPSAGCSPELQPYVCQGASGYIQRIARNEVPEPTSIALIGLGLLAASSFRRKSNC